jgi:gliding motility-associated-like protein
MFRRLFPFILFFPFLLNAQTAFISGNDTICDNASKSIIKVDFTGESPFIFSYSINGINQSSITTLNTTYLILTSIPGIYTLQSFNDIISVGTISGSAMVTVLESPTAIIHLDSDTLSVNYPIANFVSQSIGSIVSWDWNFGDNTSNINTENVSHMYSDSSAIYQSTLIIQDINGCFDTAIRNVWVNEEYWLYIPTSFTPNNDKINDKFCIEYHAIRENTFLFKVYNAQGDLLYQSTNPSELKCSNGNGWDGKYFDDNRYLPLDTYAYEIYFQDFEGWKHQEYGTINLVR